MSLGSTWPGRPAFGVSSQIYPPSVSGETALTRESNEVSVLIPPPQQDHIDHVVIVLVNQLHAVYITDGVAQILVAIVVIADLLHHLARLDTEPFGLPALILGLARGRAH